MQDDHGQAAARDMAGIRGWERNEGAYPAWAEGMRICLKRNLAAYYENDAEESRLKQAKAVPL